MKNNNSIGFRIIREWLASKGLQPFAYQQEAWDHIARGRSGLINAPTGTGKTFSVFLGSLIQFIDHHPNNYKSKTKSGLQLIWITPLRALAKDIGRAMEEVIEELGLQWKVGIRNGDTPMSERQKQKMQMPEVLIITPESLHLLLGQKHYPEVFDSLKIIAVDEWHELIGGKRGVQVELALSRIIGLSANKITGQGKPKLQLSLWGISATIGNLQQAMEVLLHPLQLLGQTKEDGFIVRARLQK
ncbi:MAG TPA: DEAD/DEAH box helicase, partial [Flavisolibacter sp.]